MSTRVFASSRDWSVGALSGLILVFVSLFRSTSNGGTLSDPRVDDFNLRVGTQTFAPKYRFTTNTALVETALAIHGLGSDVIKFYMGRSFSGQYGISLPASITNLTALAAAEPSCRRVFDMPFKHLLFWAYCFSASSDAWWQNGYSASEQQKEYDEIYELSRYLLTNYNNSGKSFYLGHWEGDWYLLPNYDTAVNPSPTAIQGMIDWLNTRQKAVDDALRNTPHSNVWIYHYTEVNRVRDAMVNAPGNNQRLVNTVLPYVTNIDFVSWSSYDGMNLSAFDLTATLNYIQSNLPAGKNAAIAGRRVLIGEYGWGGSLSSSAQEPPTRSYIQRLLPWSPRFILFWQMYDNEARAYWLIDSNNVAAECYFLHQRFLNQGRLCAAQFVEANSRLPSDSELAGMLVPLLDAPLSPPTRLIVSNLDITHLSSTAAMLRGKFAQGVYGDEQATVRIFWGNTDGGTNRSQWDHSLVLGVNTNFNPSIWNAALTNLVPRTNYFYRFSGSNSTAEVWAPISSPFSTATLNRANFGSAMRVVFQGYDRSEPLYDFPVLIRLGTNVPGFSYGRFGLPNGADLRFADMTAARLIPHEIEEWNPHGTSSVWVRVPRLADSNDCIWAYWGNPAVSNVAELLPSTSVWTPGHEIVYHLKESSLPYSDSTGRHPALTGDPPASDSAGLIGRSANFNGTSDYLNAGAVSLPNQFTLSGWVRVDPIANSIQTLWGTKAGGSATAGYALFVNSWQTRDGKLIFETGNGAVGAAVGTPTNAVLANNWQHVGAVVDRSTPSVRLYVNGVERVNSASVRNDFPTAAALNLGRFTNNLYYFRGAVDEVRVDNVARSSDWLWASWCTVASPGWQTYGTVDVAVPGISAALFADSLRLTWDATGVGFRLMTATNLNGPAGWTASAVSPKYVNGCWEVSLVSSIQESQFFRLESP